MTSVCMLPLDKPPCWVMVQVRFWSGSTPTSGGRSSVKAAPRASRGRCPGCMPVLYCVCQHSGESNSGSSASGSFYPTSAFAAKLLSRKSCAWLQQRTPKMEQTGKLMEPQMLRAAPGLLHSAPDCSTPAPGSWFHFRNECLKNSAAHYELKKDRHLDSWSRVLLEHITYSRLSGRVHLQDGY